MIGFKAIASVTIWSLSLSATALAQPNANGLVPGIAPLAPKAPPAVSAEATGHDGSSASAAAAAPAAKSSTSYDYRLGPGDKLRIIVFGEENLTGEYSVAGSGNISFPLIGDVKAAGRTVGAVSDEITAALKDGYLKNPEVSAEVLTFRPFYILGEVSKPGEYPYSDQITVLNAIATAGGFTYRANKKYVFIKHAGASEEQRVALKDGLLLLPGDTIRVTERLF